jgi:hypothetical protein
MLDSHNDTLILGNWKGRTVEGTDVSSTPNFNEENEHAASKMQEYEGGFLNGASLGLDFDWDDIQIKPELGFGETPVLVKCECYEASLCAIPSNPEALKMKASGESLNPEQFRKKLQLKLSASNTSQNNQHMQDLTLLKSALKLAVSTGDSDTVAAAIGKINEGEAAIQELATLKLSIATEKSAEIKLVLDEAQAAGKFTVEERPEYEAQAKLNLAFTKKVLGLAKPAAAPAGNPIKKLLTNGGGGKVDGNIELSKETYDKMHKAGTLLALKTNDPDTYNALLAAKKEAVNASGVVTPK